MEGQIEYLFCGSGSWNQDGQMLVAKCKVGNRDLKQKEQMQNEAVEVYMKIELPVVKLCWRVK